MKPYLDYTGEVETIKLSYNNANRSINSNIDKTRARANEIRKQCTCENDEPCDCFHELELQERYAYRALEEEYKSLIDRVISHFTKALKTVTSLKHIKQLSGQSEIGALIRYIEQDMDIDLTLHSDSINFLDEELRLIRNENQHDPQWYSKDQFGKLDELILQSFEKTEAFLKFICNEKYEKSLL